MARSRKKPARPIAAPTPEWPHVVEVYGDPSYVTRGAIDVHSEPSFVNELRVERYRITIEKIVEPPIVVLQRLRGLWRTMKCNSHTWETVWRYAQTLGLSREEAREMFKIDEQGIARKKEH